MNRRRFAFWFSLGLFSLANKLRVYGLDELAAALLNGAARTDDAPPNATEGALHWRLADNGVWRWYERERFVDGKWTLTGITTPVRMETGEKYDDHPGYLDESEVPAEMLRARAEGGHAGIEVQAEEFGAHTSTDKRRERHGRPPSKWLRSLNADELRIWLESIDPPEADVSGMSFWTHLTRDHMFDPLKIEGLSIDEQAKLHAAAHAGY
jgi:hypothetical protein